MRRTDTLLVVVVGAFAFFVMRQVTSARRAAAKAQRENVHLQAAPQTKVKNPTAPPRIAAVRTDSVVSAASAAVTPAGRDPRRDVAGSYFSDMVADLKGELVRWPDRRDQGLRVWVQSNSPVRDWNVRYAQMARDAFDDWGGGSAGLPMRFDFILDSATADVRILWTEQFAPSDGQRVANTLRTSDQRGWITSAQIMVAVHDSAGRAIPPAGLAGIVRHEAGHALGLGHSNDSRTKMYPIEMVPDIAPADRLTLRLLYEFPPGVVR